jgi:hypothetical protein
MKKGCLFVLSVFYDESEKDKFLMDVVGRYYGIDLQNQKAKDQFMEEYLGCKILEFADGHLLRCHPSVMELFSFFSSSMEWIDPLEKVLEHGVYLIMILGMDGNGKKGKRYFMEQIPEFYQDQVRTDFIAGAGHSIHLDKPQEFMRSFDDFISDVEIIRKAL